MKGKEHLMFGKDKDKEHYEQDDDGKERDHLMVGKCFTDQEPDTQICTGNVGQLGGEGVNKNSHSSFTNLQHNRPKKIREGAENKNPHFSSTCIEESYGRRNKKSPFTDSHHH